VSMMCVDFAVRTDQSFRSVHLRDESSGARRREVADADSMVDLRVFLRDSRLQRFHLARFSMPSAHLEFPPVVLRRGCRAVLLVLDVHRHLFGSDGRSSACVRRTFSGSEFTFVKRTRHSNALTSARTEDARRGRSERAGRGERRTCVEKARIRRRGFGAMTRAMRERGSNTLSWRGSEMRVDRTRRAFSSTNRDGEGRRTGVSVIRGIAGSRRRTKV